MPTLQDGREAIDSGNIDQARLIFQSLLQENPRDENAWLGLAEVVTDIDDKRVCYENVLKIDRNNRAAKDGLRDLEPKEDPLVAALSSQIMSREDDDEEDDFEQSFEPEPRSSYASPPAETSSSEVSTPILVAIGLALSVLVFAVFGGAVFYALSNLVTP